MPAVRQRRTCRMGLSFSMCPLLTTASSDRRQALCELGTTDRAMLAIFKRLHVAEDYIQRVLEWTRGAKLLKDLSPHLQSFVAQMVQATHFQVNGGSHIIQTQAGVRPGDSIANVLYAFLQALFLAQLRALAQAKGYTCHDALAGSQLEGQLLVPTWADDCVALLSAKSPALLLDRFKGVAAIAHDLVNTRGLAPNYSQGRTEALIQFLGPGAQSARKSLHIAEGSLLRFHVAHGEVTCHTVSHYTHLGGKVHCKGGVLVDILQAGASALAATRPLARNVLRNSSLPGLPFVKRRQALQSLGFSRLLFSA